MNDSSRSPRNRCLVRVQRTGRRMQNLFLHQNALTVGDAADVTGYGERGTVTDILARISGIGVAGIHEIQFQVTLNLRTLVIVVRQRLMREPIHYVAYVAVGTE